MGESTIRLVPPHKLALKVGAGFGIGVAVLQGLTLLLAAFLDGSLFLPGEDVGLLEHPGMLAIIIGDVLLFLACIQAGGMSRKIGRKFPSPKKALARRYFRRLVWRRIFGREALFLKAFLFLSVIGALALVNQSVRLADPVAYYGHDTFDSVSHPFSFWANRINLFTSWCIVIPLFSSYLFVHTLAVRQFFRKFGERGLASFEASHPDRSGGYSFYGWLDTAYVLGIAVVLAEVIVLMVTHRAVTLGNVLAIVGVTTLAIWISLFSIQEILRVVRQQERKLKMTSFSRRLRKRGRLSVEYAALVYGLKFSPYTTTAFRVAVGMRAVVVLPALFRVIEYVNAGP